MRIMKSSALALAVLSVAGCKSSSNDANEGATTDINTPGRTDVSAQVTFPSDYFLAQTLEAGQAESLVTLFDGYGYSFDVPEEVAELFYAGGSASMSESVEKDGLVVAEAFNPVNGHYLSALVGFNNDSLADNLTVSLNPVSDAVSDLTRSINPDLERGLLNEFQAIPLRSVLFQAAETQLILEGYTLEEAGAASDADLHDAMDRLLVDGSDALADARDFFSSHISTGLWYNMQDSATLQFFKDGVFYKDSSGNVYEGTYTLEHEPYRTFIRLDLVDLGVQDIEYNGILDGGETLDLLGQTFYLDPDGGTQP